jgi:hypothetical protein
MGQQVAVTPVPQPCTFSSRFVFIQFFSSRYSAIAFWRSVSQAVLFIVLDRKDRGRKAGTRTDPGVLWDKAKNRELCGSGFHAAHNGDFSWYSGNFRKIRMERPKKQVKTLILFFNQW